MISRNISCKEFNEAVSIELKDNKPLMDKIKIARESLHEILKPTVVDCNVSEVVKWDGLNE